jgi:hypothetical protein
LVSNLEISCKLTGIEMPPELPGTPGRLRQKVDEALPSASSVLQQIEQRQAQEQVAEIRAGLLDPNGVSVTLEDYLHATLTPEAAALQQQVPNLTASYQTISDLMQQVNEMQRAAIGNIR